MMNVNVISPQMKVNVESILMPKLSQNYLNENGVQSNIKITEKPTSTCYKIEVVFMNQVKNPSMGHFSSTGSDDKDRLELTPRRINSIRIEQQFDDSYINHYELNVMLSPSEYQMLFYNYKDLRCTVRFYASDVNTNKIYGQTEPGDPILVIEDAYCIFKDKQDILKRTPKEALIPNDSKDKNTTHQEQFLDNILFQIIPKEDYTFRATNCNLILNNSTVEDAIKAIISPSTHDCIDALMLVAPDNKTKYKNIIIPPMLSIPESLLFLQSYYGVYSKGMGFYYQLGTLYVYPRYETNPILPKDKATDWKSTYTKNKYATVSGQVILDEYGDGGMTHIYMVGDGNYTGMQYYHAYEGSTIHIVSNSPAIFRDMADSGMENIGYGYTIHHSARDVDAARTILEGDTPDDRRFGVWPIDIHANPNNSYLALDGQNKEIGMTSTLANIQYADDKSNMFTLQSRLNSYRRNVAAFEWHNAVPFTFRPGYRVCYHYDGEDENRRELAKTSADSTQYMTKNGVVDEVTYTFTLTKIGETELYVCKADVGVSLEVDKTNHLDGI